MAGTPDLELAELLIQQEFHEQQQQFHQKMHSLTQFKIERIHDIRIPYSGKKPRYGNAHEEDEAEELLPEDLPQARASKGFRLADSAAAAPEAPDPTSAKGLMRQRLLDKQHDMCAAVEQDFRTTITPQEYTDIVAKLDEMRFRYPDGTRGASVPLRDHVFVIPTQDRVVRLPIFFLPQKEREKEKKTCCIVCNEPIVDEYVGTAVCFKVLIHPKCAIVLSDAITWDRLYKCPGSICWRGEKRFKCNQTKFEDAEFLQAVRHCIDTIVSYAS